MTPFPYGFPFPEEHPAGRGLLAWLRHRREPYARDHEDGADAARRQQRYATALREQWSDIVVWTGLVRKTTTLARIPHTHVPEVVSVKPGPPVEFLIKMLPGQVLEDYTREANRLAKGLGVATVRCAYSHYDGYVSVTLLSQPPAPDTA